MKAIHELKIHPQYLNKIKLKEKTFELRKDDRDYEIGDTILLKGYINGHYTVEYALVRIVYLLRNYEGLSYDYCILGIECISEYNKGNDCDMINRIINRFNELLTDNVDMDTGEHYHNWVVDMQNGLIMQLGEIVKEEFKNNGCKCSYRKVK